jgi:NTP pyrophosphatase (non-canonical NTP hydrolase)
MRHERLTIDVFTTLNINRCVSPHGFNHQLDAWSLSDWVTAVTGELGEAANVVKKLNRIRDGTRGNTHTESELRQKLATEIADVYIYLDLLAAAAGFRLSALVTRAFDEKSEAIGYPRMFNLPAENDDLGSGVSGPGLGGGPFQYLGGRANT